MRRLGADFDEFVVSASPGLMKLAVRLCGNTSDAEDLLQTALWRVAKRWPVDGGNPVGYARRTVVNLAADGWRRRGRTPHHSSLGEAVDVATSGSMLEERDALLTALRALPPRQRTIIVLRYWEDLSIEETAALLSCSTGTVKSTASRGLERLRGYLDPEGARP